MENPETGKTGHRKKVKRIRESVGKRFTLYLFFNIKKKIRNENPRTGKSFTGKKEKPGIKAGVEERFTHRQSGGLNLTESRSAPIFEDEEHGVHFPHRHLFEP